MPPGTTTSIFNVTCQTLRTHARGKARAHLLSFPGSRDGMSSQVSRSRWTALGHQYPVLSWRPRPRSASFSSKPIFTDRNNSITLLRTVAELRPWRKSIQNDRKTLGFVPTMGAFHEGHLQLAREAAAENDQVVISIYVNPTQFGVNEDLDAYPRTFESDLAKLQLLNEELDQQQACGRVTAVFCPTSKEIYPILPPSSEIDGKGSFVTITPIGELLEGASRPVFFRGVATVCMKLFNIVRPETVYFGQKDIQQSVIIKRLVRDFHHDINVRIVPTARESDGLAMSSRNVYLGKRRRLVAPTLYTALKIAADRISRDGVTAREDILKPANEHVEEMLDEQMGLSTAQRALFMLDYISLADPGTMEEVDAFDSSVGAILSGALKMMPVEELLAGEDEGEAGGVHRPVRLIDNIVLGPRTESERSPS